MTGGSEGAPIATRAPAPRPRRLSRRALATFAGASAIGIAAALGYALSAGHHTAPAPETVSIDHGKDSDVLANAPTDYATAAMAKVANAPAPGVGMAVAPSDVTPPPITGATGSEVSADEQRLRQQRDSARASKLFAGDMTTHGEQVEAAAAQPISAPPSASPVGNPTASIDAQDRKTAFVAGTGAQPTVNSGRLTAPAGRYVISAGSTIAAALITGLSSDLPGEVVAQVTEDVFDSTTGRMKLIPQGSRLIGSYDAHVTFGQSRALVVWTRIILPDGRSLDLDRMIGTDASGQSGFADRVNHHMGKLLEAGLLSTLFGVGSNIATSGGNNDDIAFAIRDSAGQSIERAGDRLVEHQLDVQPTITVRPGARVRVLVGRDLLLDAWSGTGG